MKKAIKLIWDRVGGLSDPSKMPCYGWSISAWECKTGGRLAEVSGTVCFGCYARKGHYNRGSVKNAVARRLALYNSNPAWEYDMAKLIAGLNQTHFRWFDSGDLQDATMLERIATVAMLTPGTRHWLPTREYAIVKEFLDNGGIIPHNLIVRLSAHKVDGTAPDMGLPTATVVSDAALATCPAPNQDGKCMDCRICWNSENKNTAYAIH